MGQRGERDLGAQVGLGLELVDELARHLLFLDCCCVGGDEMSRPTKELSCIMTATFFIQALADMTTDNHGIDPLLHVLPPLLPGRRRSCCKGCCFLCKRLPSRIVRQHSVTRAQHPRPQAAAVRPSAEAIVCVAGTAARSPNGAQLAFLDLELNGLTCGMPNPWPGNIFRKRQKQ